MQTLAVAAAIHAEAAIEADHAELCVPTVATFSHHEPPKSEKRKKTAMPTSVKRSISRARLMAAFSKDELPYVTRKLGRLGVMHPTKRFASALKRALF